MSKITESSEEETGRQENVGLNPALHVHLSFVNKVTDKKLIDNRQTFLSKQICMDISLKLNII